MVINKDCSSQFKKNLIVDNTCSNLPQKRGNRIAPKEPSNTEALQTFLQGNLKTQRELLLSLNNHCIITIDFTGDINHTTNQKFYCSVSLLYVSYSVSRALSTLFLRWYIFADTLGLIYYYM